MYMELYTRINNQVFDLGVKVIFFPLVVQSVDIVKLHNPWTEINALSAIPVRYDSSYICMLFGNL